MLVFLFFVLVELCLILWSELELMLRRVRLGEGGVDFEFGGLWWIGLRVRLE